MVRNRTADWRHRLYAKLKQTLTERGERYGIELSAYHASPGIDADQVWRNLEAALDLIAAHGPIWIRRMQRMKNRIHVERTPGTRAKLVEGQLSILDSYFVANFLPAQIASSIIHEATHARIRSVGIARTDYSLAREERACRRSELRFGRALLASGAEGAEAVIERAASTLAAPDEEVGVVVDWGELHLVEVVTKLNEVPMPLWLKRAIARRMGVLDTPQGRAAFGE